MEQKFRQVTRSIWVLLIAILAALPPLTYSTQAETHLPRTLTVDNGGDTSGGACTAAANDCSLHSAIDQANADPGSTIVFQDNPHTVMLTGSSLPAITAANTTIRANPGQVVKLNVNGQEIGLWVNGDRIRIQGLYIYGANSYNIFMTLTAAQQVYIANNIIGNDDLPGCSPSEVLANHGIFITRDAPFTPGAHDAWIYGNRIECNQDDGSGITIDNLDRVRVGFKEPGSTATLESNTIRLNLFGIWLLNGASFNQIQGNVISANIADGIQLYGSTTQSNEIFANKIGTTSNGLQADGNGSDGIEIRGAIATLVGGTAARRNIISGNAVAGIDLNFYASGNIIQSNYIGTNLPGTAVIPNQEGISLRSAANNNLIGGTTPDHLNIIAGNSQAGITIRDSGTDNNTLTLNDIGLNSALAEASQALPNGAYGIWIIGGPQHNKIGSAATIAPRPGSLTAPRASSAPLESQIIDPAANLVWYNGVTGIVIDNASNNLIRSNSIRKSDQGIYLRNNAMNNIITRTLMYENDFFGIVEDTGATNNSWFELSMYSNNTNGRQISQSLINQPRVTSISRPTRTFEGTSGPNALVEVYAHNGFIWTFNQTPVPEGQGRRFLGRTQADASGRWSLRVPALVLRGINNNCFTAIQTVGTSSSDFSQIVCGNTYLPYVIKSSPQAAVVTWISPAAGATVSGTLYEAGNSGPSGPCEVNASHSSGITKVLFYVDAGTLLNQDTVAPWNCNFDTSLVNNGLHTIKAVAYASAGSTGEASRTVNVENTDLETKAPGIRISE